MDILEYRRLSKIEDRHWWYRAIHRLIKDQIFRLLQGQALQNAGPGPVRILDAGCGTGGLTTKLGRFDAVVGVDISPHALRFVRKNSSSTFVQSSVNSLPFRNESFNVVTSVSVLYHQRVDDRAAWMEMKRILRSGGIAIVVLPAFSWLMGPHDRMTHAKRRYELPYVVRIAETNGFEVLERRYLFSLLFPLFFVKRVMERIGIQLPTDVAMPPRWLNTLLEHVCLFEWKLSRIIGFPFGSSLLLIVKKLQ